MGFKWRQRRNQANYVFVVPKVNVPGESYFIPCVAFVNGWNAWRAMRTEAACYRTGRIFNGKVKTKAMME